MNEAQWLAETNPRVMLGALDAVGRVSERKLRLFACAWAYGVWDRMEDDRSRAAVATAEAFADGLADRPELLVAFDAARQACEATPQGRGRGHGQRRESLLGGWVAKSAAEAARNAADPELCFLGPGHPRHDSWDENLNGRTKYLLSDLIRDLFGNPFRAVSPLARSVLDWNGGTIVRMAEAAYAGRLLPGGHLDPDRLAVLADALEDAGCQDAELVGHLRGPGVHVRGCWAVDRILGKG
jgi:hypothetical protein